MIAGARLTAVGEPRLLRGLRHAARLDLAAHRLLHEIGGDPTLRELVALAEAVDLRGRGGAGFPFARKIKAVARAAEGTGRETVVLVNATEGEPAAWKDKALLQHAPHLVLDGAMLAARALDARELVIGITDEGAPGRSLRAAVAEAGLGSYVRIVLLPERFITGEGGALVRGVNGDVPIPPGQKVRAAEKGVDGLPTLLSNAETFAQLALLAEMGVDRFREVGTEAEPGTVLLTVTGADGRHTVVETPTGVVLGDVLRLCGTDPGQGVMIGGYHGAWLAPDVAARVEVSRKGMEDAGAALGAGIVVPLPADTCPLGEVARVATYLAEESAGQCGPCLAGLPSIARSVTALATGKSSDEAVSAIRQGSAVVRGRGACSHPDGSTRFLLSALEIFHEDVNAHLHKGACGRKTRRFLPIFGDRVESSEFQLTIDWSRCSGHGLCGHVLPDLIQIDIFGYPVLTDTPVPARLLDDTVLATEMCPALALKLRPAAASRH